jgi:hypothetical protein
VKEKYFYGFRNIETGLFMASYRTIRYKTKTACFKTERNAIEALQYQRNKHEYIVDIITQVEY